MKYNIMSLGTIFTACHNVFMQFCFWHCTLQNTWYSLHRCIISNIMKYYFMYTIFVDVVNFSCNLQLIKNMNWNLQIQM